MSQQREEGEISPADPLGAARPAGAATPAQTSALTASIRELRSLLALATILSAFRMPGRLVDFGAAGRGAAVLPLLGAALALAGVEVVGRSALAPWLLAPLTLAFLATASGPAWLRCLGRGPAELLQGRVPVSANGIHGVGPIRATTALRGSHCLGAAMVLVLLAAGELATLATLPSPSHPATLALALLLGRWATVIHLYGSIPRTPAGPTAEFIRGLAFNPFAVASVSTMFVALSTAEAVGLGLLLVSATLALFLRIGTHRRLGGVTLATAVFSGWIVEIAVLGMATLAALAFGAAARG